MKRLGLTLLVCFIQVLCFAEAQEYSSPVVHSDRTATLKILAPNAKAVSLQGSFTSAPIPMEKDSNGIWTATVGPLEPEIHEYSFLVDGAKTIDPRNRNVKKWRILDSVLEIPGDPPQRYELRPIPHGSVHRHWYESESLGRTRGLFVYTPPYYDSEGSERYPVIFLLHGMGDDESAWLEVGKANFITDSLIAEGKAQPVVIVMPYGHAVPASRNQSEAFASNTDHFERDLLEDVIPFVRERYAVRVDALGQAIVGLSMGGGQSTTIGLRNPEKFAWIGGFSSAVSDQRADERFLELISDVGKSNEQVKLLWIGCGSSDFLLQRNKSFVTWLESKGINHIYRETEGGHNWRVWRKYLAEFLPLLFVEN